MVASTKMQLRSVHEAPKTGGVHSSMAAGVVKLHSWSCSASNNVLQAAMQTQESDASEVCEASPVHLNSPLCGKSFLPYSHVYFRRPQSYSGLTPGGVPGLMNVPRVLDTVSEIAAALARVMDTHQLGLVDAVVKFIKE